MLEMKEILEAQNKYGVGARISVSERVSYESYLLDCRQVLNDKTGEDYYTWSTSQQNKFNDQTITDFVTNNPKLVDGFVDANGELNRGDLMDRLRTDIIDCGILKSALEDDEVQEIQINDYKTIWVIKGGKAHLYLDSKGRPYQFVSDIELKTTLNRMISNSNGSTPRMTNKDPLLNARTTLKGYRVSAVNSTAITPDVTAGFDFPVTSITIRKYAPSMLTFEDFVKGGSMTEEMARFLKLCGVASVKLFCVGPTSSGKTTLLNAIAWEIPKDERIILIQNPTEIMLYERGESGTNLRNVVHWEASDVDTKDKDSSTVPSMSNFIAHALRNTPDVIIPGEVRSAEEIYQAMRAIKTGHRLLSSLHAENGKDAVARIADELASMGGSAQDYLQSTANAIDIVVSQSKLSDGNRRVMEICELTGRILEDGTAETIVLFRYVVNGKTDKKDGRILKIHGYFEQVEGLSEKLQQKFYKAGITKEDLEEFITPRKTLSGKSNLVGGDI